jgi:hypothetical protein
MNQSRMWWDGEGWILQTKTNITKAQLLRMVEYTKNDQARQIEKMQPGKDMDIYIKALSELTPGNITHRIEP